MNRTKIAFRSDSSALMGIGHVMRCLTLAKELREWGAQCLFISRALPGAVSTSILDAGFELTLHPESNDSSECESWAGVGWEQDAQETRKIMEKCRPDWLIVDHYSFDARWEDASRVGKTKLMVIDDLADRAHSADLLLDQNFGRLTTDYDGLVPKAATRLIGPDFALLRPEFVQARAKSLVRRANSRLSHIMVAMGGTDVVNATGQILALLEKSDLPRNIEISVVMGSTAPFLEQVLSQVRVMPFRISVLTDVEDMASLMVDADLAIGGGGSTSWERCCLALPTLILIMADNQKPAATALSQVKAALLLGDIRDISWKDRFLVAISDIVETNAIESLSRAAEGIVDGLGTARCVKAIDKLGLQ